MRSRLAYTLSFWLIGAVALSVLSMGGIAAWNLRQGFSTYLQTRDFERLDSFVALLSTHLQQSDPQRPLEERSIDMPFLLQQMALQDGVTPRNPAENERGRPNFGPEPGPSRPGPMRQPPPPGNPDLFGARVAVFHPNGQPWSGHPPLPNESTEFFDRPVLVNGTVVATVRLRAVQRLPQQHEVRFLRTQYYGIAVVATVLLLLALLAAWWLARQWARPLAAVQDATARIAQGELGVRLPITRHDEIGDVVNNVNHMAESLQRMEGARRRWIADMSHELRTPLTTLRGEIEALVDQVRPLTPAAVLSLRDDVLRLGRLVDDLHLLAMADLHTLPCHMAATDAVELVNHILQRYARRAELAGLTLVWGAPPPDTLPVVWDEARMDQVLTNVLENSLRYTDAPGRVEVTLKETAGRVVLCVSDSAPGVPEDDLSRLFEPLYRADAARSRHTGGSGLGLAIAQAIAQAHHGLLSAHPGPLGGVQITLNVATNAPLHLP